MTEQPAITPPDEHKDKRWHWIEFPFGQGVEPKEWDEDQWSHAGMKVSPDHAAGARWKYISPCLHDAAAEIDRLRAELAARDVPPHGVAEDAVEAGRVAYHDWCRAHYKRDPWPYTRGIEAAIRAADRARGRSCTPDAIVPDPEDDAVVEIVARAIQRAEVFNAGEWSAETTGYQEHFKDAARSVLTALRDAARGAGG